MNAFAPVTNPTPCRTCGGPTVGWGRDRYGNPRRLCKACKRTFGLIPERPLGTMRLPIEKATLVLSLLIEGVSIRSAERISTVHRDTVCKLLRLAGGKCDQIMNTLVRGLEVEDVELDELWAPILMKEKTKKLRDLADFQDLINGSLDVEYRDSRLAVILQGGGLLLRAWLEVVRLGSRKRRNASSGWHTNDLAWQGLVIH